MEKKADPKIERVLSVVEPGRREALRKILLTAAYTAPVVSSFSLDALAGATTCFAANQTCARPEIFVGTVKCKGLSLASGPTAVPQDFHATLDVQISLCEGPAGTAGLIIGGASSIIGVLRPVPFDAVVFPGKNSDTLGFQATECPYFETGQWKLEPKKDGTDTLKGNSYVLINQQAGPFAPPTAVTSYTLQCEYEMRKAGGTGI